VHALPDTLWTNAYGGSYSDIGRYVIQTTDGSFLAVGRTVSYGAGNFDVYLIKTNSTGDTQWTRTYGGVSEDWGYATVETMDGGYAVVGYTDSYGAGQEDVYLIKTDAEGDVLWTRTYGGSELDKGRSVIQLGDGGYAVAGYTESYGAGEVDLYLIRTDSIGDTLWTRTYGGVSSDYGYSVVETADGGFAVVGGTSSYGAGVRDAFLIRTDSNGDRLWAKTYGGYNDDSGFSLAQVSDGGFIVAGYTRSYGAGERDVYVVRTDADGDTLWTKVYGGIFNDYGWSVALSTQGGYIVAGETESYGAGGYDVYLLMMDADGDTLWTVTYGGNNYDNSYSVSRASDGSYIAAGSTDSYGAGELDIYLITLVDIPWRMFHHDRQRTGRSPYIGPDEPILKWSCDIGGDVHSSPAVAADGTIYVGSYDNKLYAVRPDGSLKWSYITNGYISSSPAVTADGTVYVGSDRFYAISADGSLQWSYIAGSAFQYSSPAVATDGTIYIGSEDNTLYALSPDGSLAWTYTTDGFIYSSPAIGPDGTIVVGSLDNRLYALNSDGLLMWSTITGDGIYSSPAVDADGTVYIGSLDYKVYAINSDGSLRWSYLTDDGVYSSPALGVDGTVYVGSSDYTVYAINPDGSLQWSYPTDGSVWSSPAVDGYGSIYIGSRDNRLYALNGDGTLRWSYATGGYVESSPAVGDDGTIYVGSYDFVLYAFGLLDDVGVASIDSPSDRVGPYEQYHVQATVANYGDIEETFHVTCTIDGYSDTYIVRNLDPGSSFQVTFDPWTSGDCGDSYTLTVTTHLIGDENPANDTLSMDILVVGVHDAGVVSIDGPPGTVEPYTSYVPQATVGNAGTCVDTFEVTCTIDGYADADTVTLDPGTTIQISFDPWTSGNCDDVYTLTVTTHLIGDENPANDTLSMDILVVGVHDAGVVSIDDPPGTVEPYTSYVPQATVGNAGTCVDTFEVTCTIDGYADADTVAPDPGTSIQISFDPWTSGHCGDAYTLTVTTHLIGDENPANDTLSMDILVVGVHDAGVVSIDDPPDTVPPYTSYVPRATVGNAGTCVDTFEVTCTIDGYADADTVALDPGISTQISFDPKESGVCGDSYTMTVITNLIGDENPANDTLSKDIFVDGIHDAAVVSIDGPPDTVEPKTSYVPMATVENLGVCLDTIDIVCTIDSYTSLRTVYVLPGDSHQITFDPWVSGNAGDTYVQTVATFLPGDVNPDNDTLSHTIVVVGTSITLTPDAPVVERGGILGYTVEVTNNTDEDTTFDYWSDLYLWNGEPYANNPIFGPREATVKAGRTRSRHLSHRVPAITPLRTYSLCGRMGNHPDDIWDEDCFEFTVVEGSANGNTGTGWGVIEDTF
jgi:outer membrane protein assembly factor BamB